MIDWKQVEIKNVRAGQYIVYDRLNDRALLSVVAAVPESAKVQRIQAKDLSTGLVIGEQATYPTNPALVDWAMKMVESLVCTRCRDNWGSVCDTCVTETGDDLFLAMRQIERMAPDERSEDRGSHDR